MYLILKDTVMFGMDGFLNSPRLGSQFRLICFGLVIWVAWGDKDPDGNGYDIYFKLLKHYEVL
tara:strand:- start:27 stop:215 length:189 start_codon:yes stop_codon:yes gene_type:complete